MMPFIFFIKKYESAVTKSWAGAQSKSEVKNRKTILYLQKYCRQYLSIFSLKTKLILVFKSRKFYCQN